MRLRKNKLKKLNTFDVMDCELLEKYLNEMALEGWMVYEINRTNIRFEKVDGKEVNFFVDITTKGLEGNNEQNLNYINSYKDKNVEYICGNEKFQIFINNSSDETLNRKDLSHKIVFKEYYSMIFVYCLTLFNIYLIMSKHENLITLITSSIVIAFMAVFTVILFINLYIFILKINKYNQIVKKKNKDFNIKSNFNKKYICEKYLNYVTSIFLVVGIILIAQDSIFPKMVTKNDIPLVLEDFNQSVIGNRQVYKLSSSSPFGKYYSYSDYAFVYDTRRIYDEVSKSYYDEHYEDSKGFISYSLIESKHSKVLDIFLNSTLSEYDNLGYTYKTESNEAEDWGAKSVYNVCGINNFNEKVVIYDDKIITFEIENKEIDEKTINIVKEKLIN